MTLKEIAEIVACDYSGENLHVESMNTLKDATPSQISFVSNAKYVKDIKDSNACAIIVDEKTKANVPDGCVALVVENPYWEMAKLSKYFAPAIEDNSLPKAKIGEGSKVSDKAEIANGAVVGKNCTILAGVYVGANSTIGDNTVLYPNVVVYRDCTVGSNCIIHANSTIGGDGFGFATSKMGEHLKIYQNGNAIVEDEEEIEEPRLNSSTVRSRMPSSA